MKNKTLTLIAVVSTIIVSNYIVVSRVGQFDLYLNQACLTVMLVDDEEMNHHE